MNRVILITGANNGIGLETAKALLAQGERVAGLDLDIGNLCHTKLCLPNLRSFVCDVTDLQRVQEVVNEVARVWGGVDVLINNACIASFRSFDRLYLNDIRREFEVNYFGYLNLICAVLPVMEKQGYGIVHNFSSGVGYTGMPGMVGYTSTKGAIEALTRTLSLQYAGRGITFNVIHPPLTRTKSASGLGIPAEMMADPETVGKRLAKRIGKKPSVITPDLLTAVQRWMSYHLRVPMGRFMASLTARAKQSAHDNKPINIP